MRKDTVFRGCTRPAMLMGVPVLPLDAPVEVELTVEPVGVTW